MTYEDKSCGFTRGIGSAGTPGTPVFFYGRWGEASAYAGFSVFGLTSTGLIWGEQSFLTGSADNYTFIDAKKFTASPLFHPRYVNASGQAAGHFAPAVPGRYAADPPVALTAKALCALGDGGVIFGLGAGGPPDPGQPVDALPPYFWSVTDGTPSKVSDLLPAEFRRQISFNINARAEINSTGDVLFNTPTLEGPEDSPAWNVKSILWTRQTSAANPNGTLALVPNPGQQLNAHRLMVTIKAVYPLDVNGQPVTTQPSHQAAVLLLPVEFKTYPDSQPGPEKAHKRNLPHLAGYDAYYGKEWGKCASKVWEASHKLNLIDYLTGSDDPSMRTLFEQSLKWKEIGTEQTSHEADYGSEPAEDKHQHLFVEVVSKSGGDTIDRLIITVVPRSTKTKWDAWYPAEKADMSWLAELPPMFSWIETTVGTDGLLPRPDRNFNPFLYAVPHEINVFYHPSARYEMRSYATAHNHGGQVCYDSSGSIITSGVSAGSADKEAPFPAQLDASKHRDADVKPFIWAAQLDGNPVEGTGGIPPYTNLTAPMLYEGDYIMKYLEVRPPIPNNKPRLTPGATP